MVEKGNFLFSFFKFLDFLVSREIISYVNQPKIINVAASGTGSETVETVEVGFVFFCKRIRFDCDDYTTVKVKCSQ